VLIPAMAQPSASKERAGGQQKPMMMAGSWRLETKTKRAGDEGDDGERARRCCRRGDGEVDWRRKSSQQDQKAMEAAKARVGEELLNSACFQRKVIFHRVGFARSCAGFVPNSTQT